MPVRETNVLHTLDKGLVAVSGNLEAGGNLAEQRDNCLARVASNDGDGGVGGLLLARVLLGESLGTNDVKGGHTKQTLGVEDTSSLENLGGNRDSGVHGVGDNEGESLGGELGNSLDESLDNSSVDLEKVITAHTGLAYIKPQAQQSTRSYGSNAMYSRGIPAGMTTTSAPVRASFKPSSLGR